MKKLIILIVILNIRLMGSYIGTFSYLFKFYYYLNLKFYIKINFFSIFIINDKIYDFI